MGIQKEVKKVEEPWGEGPALIAAFAIKLIFNQIKCHFSIYIWFWKDNAPINVCTLTLWPIVWECVFSGGCCTITKCKCILADSGCLSESWWANLMVTLRQSLSFPSARSLLSFASQWIKPKKHSLYLTHAASASLKTSQAEMIVQKFFLSQISLPESWSWPDYLWCERRQELRLLGCSSSSRARYAGWRFSRCGRHTGVLFCLLLGFQYSSLRSFSQKALPNLCTLTWPVVTY